jgi:hypothetical protein
MRHHIAGIQAQPSSVEQLAKAVQTERPAGRGATFTPDGRDPIPFERSRVRWFGVDLQNVSRAFS